MASVITIAGEKLFAAKAQANEQLDIDTFIFANIPGQDPAAPINREEGLPTDFIVAQQTVQQVGRINDNVVVYSTVLDSITGPFEFNWVGLYSSINNTLVAINHVPNTAKTKTESGVAGNTLNRNFGIEYSGIADLTGIDVAPETWQLDFTARLSGMDKLTQQLAADMNGKDWFIDDGFKVESRSTINSFKILPGVGYVGGLRIELDNEHFFSVAESEYFQFVYVDAWLDGDASSTWSPKFIFKVSNDEIDDYVDALGVKHFIFKLAHILSDKEVINLITAHGLVKDISQHVEKPDRAHSGNAIDIPLYGNASIRSSMIDYLERAKPVRPFKANLHDEQLVVFVGDSHTAGQGATSNGLTKVPELQAPNGVNDGFHKRVSSSGTFVDQLAREIKKKHHYGLVDRVAGADEQTFYNTYSGSWGTEANNEANVMGNKKYGASNVIGDSVVKRGDPTMPRNWFKINFRKYSSAGLLNVEFREFNPNGADNLTRTKNTNWRPASDIALYRKDGGELDTIDMYSDISSFNNSVTYILPHKGLWEVKLTIETNTNGGTGAYVQSHEIEVCQFLNAGRGNHTTLDYLGDVVGVGAGGAGSYDHTDHLAEVLNLKPSLVVLQPMIINDWFHGVNLSDTRSALSEMIKRIKDSGADLIVLGPAPVISENFQFDWQKNPDSSSLSALSDDYKGQGRYLDYYDVVEQVCGYYSVSFINTFYYFLYRFYKDDHQNWTLGDLAGRIHVNQHGHNIYFQALARYMGLTELVIN